MFVNTPPPRGANSLTHRELQAAFEWKSHRAEAVPWVMHVLEVFAVCVTELGGVVADNDRAWTKGRRDDFKRGSGHWRPDVDQHEVHRATEVLEGLAQVALAQVDEVRQARLGEVCAGGGGFVGLVLRAYHGARP